MRHILIYLKIMVKALSEIIIFPRRIINEVYKKNIKFEKSQNFRKVTIYGAVFLLINPGVPFDQSNTPWTKSP